MKWQEEHFTNMRVNVSQLWNQLPTIYSCTSTYGVKLTLKTYAILPAKYGKYTITCRKIDANWCWQLYLHLHICLKLHYEHRYYFIANLKHIDFPWCSDVFGSIKYQKRGLKVLHNQNEWIRNSKTKHRHGWTNETPKKVRHTDTGTERISEDMYILANMCCRPIIFRFEGTRDLSVYQFIVEASQNPFSLP